MFAHDGHDTPARSQALVSMANVRDILIASERRVHDNSIYADTGPRLARREREEVHLADWIISSRDQLLRIGAVEFNADRAFFGQESGYGPIASGRLKAGVSWSDLSQFHHASGNMLRGREELELLARVHQIGRASC